VRTDDKECDRDEHPQQPAKEIEGELSPTAGEGIGKTDYEAIW
jgi:hypothetical protein